MKTILDLIKANVELNNLNSALEKSNQHAAALEQQISDASAKSAEDSARLGAQHAEDVELLANKIKLLEETNLLLEGAQKSADDKAVEIAASVGVDAPVEEVATEEKIELPVEALWDQYRALEGKKDRRDFYLKNIKPRN